MYNTITKEIMVPREKEMPKEGRQVLVFRPDANPGERFRVCHFRSGKFDSILPVTRWLYLDDGSRGE